MCLLRRFLFFPPAILSLVGVGVGPVVAAAASAAGPVACGSTVTTNLVLDRDLLDCTRDGLLIGADNITIDLNGHVLDGTGSAGSAGIRNSGHNGVTVKGGVIEGFERGVVISNGDSNRVLNSTIARNVADGIFGDALSSGMVVKGNRVTKNGAILPGQKPTPATAWADGIDVHGAGAWISRNTVTKSRDDGIDVGGTGVRVENNKTAKNGVGSTSADGIDVDGIGARIEKNRAIGNGDDGIGIGIHARHPMLRNNTAKHNHNRGIDSRPQAGVVDGGGNRASGNGDSNQCVGVVCR